MSDIRFVWDRRKARTNLAKHGISFEEAQTVFLDENARLISDPDHSGEEERLLLMGYSLRGQCITVSHCWREGDSVVRVISARLATPPEEAVYWRFR